MPSTTMTITGPAVVEGSITDAPTHVWGFGSLLHNPGFEYDERVNGYIKGYRQFCWHRWCRRVFAAAVN